jgi:flagellar hook-associated protein 2
MSVTDVTGTSAADLNIAGTATTNSIDGALKESIQVNAGDTLATVQSKLQALGFGVAANIINDGSSQSPYRLSVTALNSGTAGSVIIDGGTTGLNFSNLVQAQNAAVFVGGTGSSQPLLVTSNTNQVTNIIPGVTLSLLSASSAPVTLSITRDGSAIAKQLQTFTDTFNGLVDSLNTYTEFNSTTNQGGLLLGDPTTQNIETQMYAVFQGVVSTAGQYRTLGDIGMTLTDGAKITFNADTFNSAFAANPDAVSTLFSQTTTGLGSIIDQSMNTLIDPVSGAITIENQTLANENTDFQTQITQLNSILAQKKQNLTDQFNNMESVLAGLQSQQAALSSLTGSTVKASSTSSVGSSAGSSSSGSSSSTSGTSG